MDDELWRGQTRGWRMNTHKHKTHMQTDKDNDNTRRLKLASGKIGERT